MTCFLSRQRSLRPRLVAGTRTHLDSGCSVRHLTPMCNRFRSIKEWSDIPRRFHSGPRLNFEFNPNVAPTELVPILVARFDNLGKGALGAITAWVALASAQSGGSLSNPNRFGDAGSSGRRSP